MDDFPFSWECHHSSFFRGVEINHQPDEPFGRENGGNFQRRKTIFEGPQLFRQAEILSMGKSHAEKVEFLRQSRRTEMIFCLIHPIAINERKQLLY